MKVIPSALRRHLDDWPFWVGVAYFGLVSVVVALYFLNSRTAQAQADSARNEAVRIAEQRAAAESAYSRCADSIKPTRKVSTHVMGVNEAFQVLLANSIRNHQATPPSNPQYEAQQVNIRNLRKAIRKVAAVKSFPAPTVKECEQRRRDALAGIGG